MKEKTIYIAQDGKFFDAKKSCIKYESLMRKVTVAMCTLKYNEKALLVGNAIRHTKTDVDFSFRDFMDVCSDAIPEYKETFQEVKEGKRDISFVKRILSDYSEDFPCLWKAFYRFICIDKYGIEYDQPYFVEHRLEFKGEIV